MTYKMYIMNFHTAHFGAGTLDSSKMTFAADRLFSALAIEAKKWGKWRNLYHQRVKMILF